MIQSIETSYNGYRFRSRLEARWAVFFDALGVVYRYEDQGYVMGSTNSTRYLPDFYMPTWDKYVEIKPKKQKGTFPASEYADAVYKAGLLTQESDKAVLLIYGDPWPGSYEIMLIVPCDRPGHRLKSTIGLPPHPSFFCVGMKSSQVYVISVPKDVKFDQAQKKLNTLLKQGRTPFLPLYCPLRTNEQGVIYYAHSTEDQCRDLNSDYKDGIVGIIGGSVSVEAMKKHETMLDRAFFAARSARFEHGETPKVQRGRQSNRKQDEQR